MVEMFDIKIHPNQNKLLMVDRGIVLGTEGII